MPRFALLEALRTLVDPGAEWADYGPSGRSEWLDMDWSRWRRRMSIAGSDVEYVDLGSGSGPPIVFIHGLSACWQTWLENIPFFAREHRVIAMDLPGFGRSTMPVDGEITIENYARWTAEMLERLEIQRATVVGNSMGGFVGAELAIRRPELVERLVLVSAAILWQEYRRAQPLVALARTTDASLGRAVVSGQKALVSRPRLRAAALALGGFRYPHLLPRELQVEILRTARRTRAFLPALEALAGFPLREELAKIRCPTLVVWGSDDTLVGVRHAHELEASIPGARKVIFERTGHVPMLERPDRFNRELAQFVAEAPQAGTAAPAAAQRDAAA